MTGTVTPSRHTVPQRVIDRIWERVDVRNPDECWPWKLSTAKHGYGQVGWSVGGSKSAMTTAHRVAWMAANGPIPEGMTIDHLCRNRPCCNPSHLRLLSNQENAAGNGQAMQTHCKHGHEFTPANTYRKPTGHRGCRVCIGCGPRSEPWHVADPDLAATVRHLAASGGRAAWIMEVIDLPVGWSSLCNYLKDCGLSIRGSSPAGERERWIAWARVEAVG